MTDDAQHFDELHAPGLIVIDPRTLPPGTTISIHITIGPVADVPEPEPEPEPEPPPAKRYLGQA